MPVEPGQVLDGKYRIARLIGEGGMGAVYEGENTFIHRRVAIKVLNAASGASADIIRRFEREAQAAGEIGSDHILEVLDLGSLPGGDRYMVMEYLDGETLAERIHRAGRLTPRQITPITSQFLAGLAAAHAAGIIHRDLKPDNIFITKAKAGRVDFVKIIDFGISKFASSADSLHRTRAGAMMGTPVYMSPEQARGLAEADIRSDIYAVGVILYEAVTGVLPFEAETFNDLMFKIALEEPVPPSQKSHGLDPAFEAIVLKAMAKVPQARFQTVEELAEAIRLWGEKNNFAAVTLSTETQGRASDPARNPSGAVVISPLHTQHSQSVASGTHNTWAKTRAQTELKPKPRPWLFMGAALLVAAAVVVVVSVAGRGTSKARPSAGPGLLDSAVAPANAEPMPPPVVVATVAVATPPPAIVDAGSAVLEPPPVTAAGTVVVHKPSSSTHAPRPATSSKPKIPDFGY